MFRSEEQHQSGSQFAKRIAILGGIAFIAFAIVFFRLWYLEILSGEEYLEAAQDNRVRSVTVQAPRGEILDRNGKVLVDNRTALSLQVRADQLPPEGSPARKRVLSRLADASGIKLSKIRKEIREQTEDLPANPVTLERDVDQNLVYFLREHADQFPGVTAEEVSVRRYPDETLGAHLFGYVSEIGPEQLELPQYSSLAPGDRIGATGLEQQFDTYLRGRNGTISIPVDASGTPKGDQLSETPPETGNNLVLTIDKKVQAAGESAIAAYGKPASFAVLDVNDGSILGMGSYPTFDPSIYTPPASSQEIEQLTNDEDDPLFNKAIQSGYPAGSTFKAITGTASLEEGLITPTEVYNDPGKFEYGGVEWTNAGGVPNGPVDIQRALEVSSDTYFYELGRESNQAGDEAFQRWATDFGFGSLTGIDLPGEAPGVVPSAEWRDELYAQAADPESCGGKKRLYGVEAESPDGGTEVCYEVDRKWGDGDNMNFSVGQGDLLATPLQLATAYAAIANGGSLVRPHLAMKVEDPLGVTEEEFAPAPRRDLNISESTLLNIREGLHRAAQGAEGTSVGIFGGYPIDMAGKTGTAQTGSQTDEEDISWYAAFAPYDDPQIATVVAIEGGGFGSDSAAPATREIFDAYFGVSGSEIEEVADTAAIQE